MTTRPRAHRVGSQHLHEDRFVRQAVKAVAPHARIEQRLRQREAAVQFGLAGMKRGVEAGHLRHTGERMARCAHARHVVRLVQRCQRHQFAHLRDHGVVDQHRLIEAHTAVDDAVPDRANVRLARLQLAEHIDQRFLVRRGPAPGRCRRSAP